MPETPVHFMVGNFLTMVTDGFTGTGALPVPPSETLLLPAPVGTVSVPDKPPADAGVNVTLTVQLAPALRVPGQLWDALKLPVTVGVPTDIGPMPLFDTVTDCAADVEPMLVLGKLSEAVDCVLAGATPVPLTDK